MDKNELNMITQHLSQCKLIVARSGHASPIDHVVIRLLQITQDVIDNIPIQYLKSPIEGLERAIKAHYASNG